MVPVNSYAQNFEDTMLWRALGDVQHGFYVDIGAMDPDFDSVSKLFHEKGWRGVHVDANPDYCEMLRRGRPGDLVVHAAVGENHGLTEFFIVPNTGISTVVGALADQHRNAGWTVQSTQVPVITLDSIFENLDVDDVHWLKIDVEGFERAVLDGWRRSTRRPWIVVIEAIAPFSRELTHDSFESVLLEKGYRFVYFDGVNRYYVSNAHAELEKHFQYGPTLWDSIRLSRTSPMVELVVQEDEQRAAQLQAQADTFNAQLKLSEERLAQQITSAVAFREDAALARQLHLEAERRAGSLRDQLDVALEEVRVNDARLAALLGRADNLDELLSRGDREFLQTAYLTLFGRDIDPVGMRYYLARLAAGQPRAALLSDLFYSAEGRAFGAGLIGAHRLIEHGRAFRWFGRGKSGNYLRSTASAEEVRALFRLGGQAFVDKAYDLALHRAPDPTGEKHYLDLLENGHERIDVLASLRWSGEGRALGRVSPAMAAVTNWHWWRYFSPVAYWLRRRVKAKFMPTVDERMVGILDSLDCLANGRQDLAEEASMAFDARVARIERYVQDGLPIPELAVSGDDHCADEEGIFEVSAFEPLDVKRRLDVARNVVSDLLPQYAEAIEASHGVIICSPDIPSASDLRPGSIWYAVGADFAEMEFLPELPSEIVMIATETVEDAAQAINLGVGLPAIAIGQFNRAYEQGSKTWRQIAGRLSFCMNAIDKAEQGLPGRTKNHPLQVGMVTTWNERCGIFTHSAELKEAFSGSEVRVYAARRDELTGEDGGDVHRLWEAGKEKNGLIDILEHLRLEPVDLLIIQFNYNFYNHDELNQFMIDVAELDIVVFIIIHSTLNEGSTPNTRITDFKDGLQRCARVIVHAPADVEWLASVGVRNNVLLMPHGVKVSQKISRTALQREVPILSTFGFCFPNKGLVEFITAIAILRDRGVRVRARMLNAVHPSQESSETLEAMRTAMYKLKLWDEIQLVTEFMELDQVEALIADTDLFVNPYWHTGESASGSVRLGLRLGIPTLVTPLPIFDDLGDAVFRAPGRESGDIADGIEKVLVYLRRESGEAKRAEKSLDKWLSAHDFTFQIERLRRIFRSIKSEKIYHKIG